jgi:O-antigen ligase
MARDYKARTRFVEDRQAMIWLIGGGSLVTLFFWASLSDPFNAPKSWILSIAGFWLFGWVLFQIKNQWKQNTLRWATILSGAYLVATTVSYLTTDNKYIGMFGAYQRRTGYLSYFCLIVFFLAASFLFDIKRLATLNTATIVVGFLVAIYGFAQHFKHDIVHWDNPYNSVISTLGNPDFSAALMAIFAVLNFGILVQKKYAKWIRFFAGINVLLLFTVIVFSKVRQGLLACLLGIIIVVIVWLFQRNKSAGYGLSLLTGIFGILGIIGMLNHGPLAKYFYKISVTYRGDYWRAGWRMFIHHPFFGVGLDRYGANFRQYRDATQVARRGPDLLSNAAHNVPLQLASTGGIFVLVTFLALMSFVFWRGIVALRNSQGAEQITVAVIFGAWVAYQSQSLISIDNLAIAIWGYILGGVVVGISFASDMHASAKSKGVNVQQFVSSVLALALIVISSFFYKSENATWALNATRTPKSQQEVAIYESLAQKPLSFYFQEPNFQVTAALDLAQVGNFKASISLLKKAIASDPHFYNGLGLLAKIYEYQKNWSEAVLIRQRMIPLDPYNQTLASQLSQDQKSAQTKK